MKGHPEIVCLCGSTRFMEAFFDEGWRLTLKGKIVLSVGVCKHADHHGAEALGEATVKALDELHLRKIDLADSVRVLNIGGYIGHSTSREIEYAARHHKPITFMEAVPDKIRQQIKKWDDEGIPLYMDDKAFTA
jgi:hypothetical protein